MQDKDMRVRIPINIYNKYKILCIEKGLSLPKQTAQIIKSFVEMQTNSEKTNG